MADYMENVRAGFQFGQNRLEQSRRMQELKSADSLRRLQERQIAQNLQLQMEQNNLQIQYRADMEKAATAANLASSPIIPIATPMGATPFPNPQRMSQADAAYRFMLPVIAKYEPDKVPSAMQNLAMAEYRGRAAAFQDSDPEIRTEIDPVTGKQIAFSRTPRGWSRIPDDVEARQKRQFTREQIGKMVDWAKDKAPAIYAKLPKDSEGNLTVPDDQKEEIARQAGITPAVRTALEKGAIDSETIARRGRSLAAAINPSTTGTAGAIGRGLTRIGFASNLDAFKAESRARMFIASVVDSLKSDGNISEPERKLIEGATPQVNDWAQLNPEGFKIQLTQIEDFLMEAAEIARANYARLGQEPPASFVNKDDLKEKISSGQLTGDQAAEIYNKTVFKVMDDLRERIAQ